jgi:hypothetical protein
VESEQIVCKQVGIRMGEKREENGDKIVYKKITVDKE